jgi:SAM-dependent methyltransferase
MDFEEAVENAPPGWRHFTMQDVARLPRAVRDHEMARVPDGEAGERLVRGLFWTLVYHLEPEKWDELARHEPIHPELLDALPDSAAVGVDVGAGSGRLTQHLVSRCERVIAVEPSAGLRGILSRRLPQVRTIAGWAESLPLEDGCAQLTAACGAFGPEPEVLTELRRITAPGGVIALISPESPEWFEAEGWKRISAQPQRAPHHPGWIDEFFGPLDPPHELVMTRV